MQDTAILEYHSLASETSRQLLARLSSIYPFLNTYRDGVPWLNKQGPIQQLSNATQYTPLSRKDK